METAVNEKLQGLLGPVSEPNHVAGGTQANNEVRSQNLLVKLKFSFSFHSVEFRTVEDQSRHKSIPILLIRYL